MGEVRATPPVSVLNGDPHDLRITYAAPEDPEEPGDVFIRINGTWLGQGEIAPAVPDIANHEVRIGSSLNEEFPFECAEGECFVRELPVALTKSGSTMKRLHQLSYAQKLIVPRVM